MISQQTSEVAECSLALHADMFSTPEKKMETAGTRPSERRTLPLRGTPQVSLGRETDHLVLGEEPLKKRRHQLGGPEDC